MTKQSIIDQANSELNRIAATPEALGEFCICLDSHGRIAAADSSGYYPAANYRTLVQELKQFETGLIEEPFYDGLDYYTWKKLWGLFSAR